MDKELTCIVVSVYNLAQGRGPIIGDSIAIPEPHMSYIDATYKDQVYSVLYFFINFEIILYVLFSEILLS